MRSCILLLLGSLLTPATSVAATADQQAAIDRVKQLGGSVELDGKLDGKPIVKIDLGNTSAGDDDLKLFKALKQLRWLNLWRTHVTSAGLAHLEGLADLAWLDLGATRVGDHGLAHLSRLSKLETLTLQYTHHRRRA
jgi:hypothetical protein